MLSDSSISSSRRGIGISMSGRQLQQDAMMTSMSGHSTSSASSKVARTKAVSKGGPLLAELPGGQSGPIGLKGAAGFAINPGSTTLPSSGVGGVGSAPSSASSPGAAAAHGGASSLGGRKGKGRKQRGRTIEDDDDDAAFL